MPKICYIFLLDQSGSMEGERMNLSCKSLLIFLQSLNQNFYFQLIGFGSDYEYYSNEPLEYNKENIKNLMEKIKKLHADKGGTELYKPLDNIYNNKIYNKFDMRKEIILLTDGELYDKEKVINLIGSKSDKFIFNSIGIGSCDRDLVKRSALMGKGYSYFINNLNELNSTVISILDKTNSLININCTTNQKANIEENNKKILDKYGFFKHGFILDEKDIKNIEFIIKNERMDDIKIIFEKNKIIKLPDGDKLGKLIVDNYLKSGACKDSTNRIKLSKEYNILTDDTAFFAEITNEEAVKDKMVKITNKNKEASNNINSNNIIEKNEIKEEYILEDEHFGYDNNVRQEEQIHVEQEKKSFFKGMIDTIFSKNNDNIIRKKSIEYKPKKEFHFPNFHLPFGKYSKRNITMRASADLCCCDAPREEDFDDDDLCDYEIDGGYSISSAPKFVNNDNEDIVIKKQINIDDSKDNNKNVIKEPKKQINFDELILSQDLIDGNWTKDAQVEILISQEKEIFDKIKRIAENKVITDENGIITVFILYYIYENKKEKIEELKFILNKTKAYVNKIFNLEYDDIIKELETTK